MQANKSVINILKKRACVGCGACSAVCPRNSIKFIYGKKYNYPQIDNSHCSNCGLCIKSCPSSFLLENLDLKYNCNNSEYYTSYLAYSSDDNIRWDAASGGFITGFTLYLLKRNLIDGAVVARCYGENAIVAGSFIARDEKDILSARGSKYAPVSSCTVLREILEVPGRYLFIGTPCMLEAVTKVQEIFPILKERIILKIGFVCAGMAARLSTVNYIVNDGGVNIKDVYRLCYRGQGWPGRFTVYAHNDKILMDRPLINGSLTHVVGRDHYLRCKNCLDHWAKYADISVSDPWTKEMIKNEKKGQSAILMRTEIGVELVTQSIASKEIIANEISAEEFFRFNEHLLINPNHEWNSWMCLYQILIMHKWKFILPMIKYVRRAKKIVGFRTILRSKFNRHYYE